jgi:hypothetical protein
MLRTIDQDQLRGGFGDESVPKRRSGGQLGNQSARKHGVYCRDAGRIDLRKREDRAIFETIRAIEAELGGSDLTAQRRVILDGLGRKLRDVLKIESYLATLSSIVNKKRRSLIPIVLEKHRILESIRRDLETLGLDRAEPRAISIEDITRDYIENRKEPR